MACVNTTYYNDLLQALTTQAAPGTAIAGPLHSCKIHLFSATTGINPLMTAANFTEADFTGYAAVSAPAWGAVITENDGSATQFAGAAQFTVSATPTVTNTILGYWVDDGGSPAHVLFAESFADGIPMQLPGQGFLLLVKQNTVPSPNSYSTTVS